LSSGFDAVTSPSLNPDSWRRGVDHTPWPSIRFTAAKSTARSKYWLAPEHFYEKNMTILREETFASPEKRLRKSAAPPSILKSTVRIH
jgi:hypothetical protein